MGSTKMALRTENKRLRGLVARYEETIAELTKQRDALQDQVEMMELQMQIRNED
jgi:hypothetical protein